MEIILSGVLVRKNSDGQILGSMIYFIHDFEDWQKSNAIRADGKVAEWAFVRFDTSKLAIGNRYTVVYGVGYKGKAVIANLIPVDKEKN
ncbi:hypothetical protein ACQQ97_03595 [Anaerovoracaceae bacterium SGI.195]